VSPCTNGTGPFLTFVSRAGACRLRPSLERAEARKFGGRPKLVLTEAEAYANVGRNREKARERQQRHRARKAIPVTVSLDGRPHDPAAAVAATTPKLAV
jgi:hypothetical protein